MSYFPDLLIMRDSMKGRITNGNRWNRGMVGGCIVNRGCVQGKGGGMMIKREKDG